MNPQKLLEQFLGPNALASFGGQQQGGQQQSGNVPATAGAQSAPQAQGDNSIGDLISGVLGGAGGQSSQGGGFGVPGGALGGFAAGGLLGVLLGQKKFRKMAGGALGFASRAAA